MSQVHDIAKEARANSERWFPQLHDGHLDLTTFYALGLAGEAGEVCNVVKKMIRAHDINPSALLSDLATEMADVFVYLLLLADNLGVDLVAEYRAKVVVNDKRWGS